MRRSSRPSARPRATNTKKRKRTTNRAPLPGALEGNGGSGALPDRSRRPLWAEIDLDAFSHNLREVRRRIGPGSRVLAVVKANAYGHGAVPVARAAVEAGAACLGVACVDEGVQLRLAGIDAPILVLAYTAPHEAETLVRHEITAGVGDTDAVQAVAEAARRRGVQVPVHLKIDTGMARFGVRPEEAGKLIDLIEARPELRLEGMYTHFASADEADKAFTLQQAARFQAAAAGAPGPIIRHIANSAAVEDLPDLALDMVRPGIVLYGYHPSDQVSRSLDLRPVLSLKSVIARLHTLPAGETVSYGRTWTAPRDTRIALIPCGYADGVPRLLSNRGAVLVRGRPAPIVGRVCMDQFMVDVTDIPDAAVHDEAVIIGSQGEQFIGADEIARQAQTISYEVLCAVAARVPRRYLRAGRVADRTSLLEPPT